MTINLAVIQKMKDFHKFRNARALLTYRGGASFLFFLKEVRLKKFKNHRFNQIELSGPVHCLAPPPACLITMEESR